MHSKWQIWDFFQSYPRGSFRDLSGIVILQSFDPLSLRLMKDHLLYLTPDEFKPKYLAGNEVQISWLEDEFLSLSLFGNTTSFIVGQPDDMSSSVKDFILETDLTVEGRVFGFAFYSDSAFLKKLVKKKIDHHIQIESPRFWETDKLLDFLGRYFQLPLSYEAKKYIVQSIEHELMPMFDVYRLIKLNYPDKKEVSFKDIENLVSLERLDQFALATELGKKKYAHFFERLLSVDFDFDRSRMIFSFLQGHFLKMADTSYLNGKNRLTQYDKEILALAKGWSSFEIRDLLQKLQLWEMQSKMKDSFLETELRQAHLLSIKGSWIATLSHKSV